MKRTLIAALALCLALAGCGAGESAPDAAGTPEAASQAAVASAGAGDEAPTGTAGDAGEVRSLDQFDSGHCYDLWMANDGTGDLLLLDTDYATAAQTPLCNVPGCAHDSTDCPARTCQTLPINQIAADSGQVFVCYYMNLPLETGNEAMADAINAFIAKDGPAVPHIDVYNADGSARRRLAEFPDLDGRLTMLAVDDARLYLLEQFASGTAASDDDTCRLLAVDRQTGETATVAEWPWTFTQQFVLARGRSLYAMTNTLSNPGGGRITGGQVRRLDVDTGDWSDCFTWENEWDTQTDDASSSLIRYVTAIRDPGQGFVHCDNQNGSFSAVDPDTGAETLVCDSIPVGTESLYHLSVNATENHYVVCLTDTSGGPARQFLVPKTGGGAVELPMRQYVSARGDQPIRLLDEWNGQFFAHVDYIETPITYLSKDGLPQEGTEIQDVYALLPVEDALAGQPNYRTIETWAGTHTGR